MNFKLSMKVPAKKLKDIQQTSVKGICWKYFCLVIQASNRTVVLSQPQVELILIHLKQGRIIGKAT